MNSLISHLEHQFPNPTQAHNTPVRVRGMSIESFTHAQSSPEPASNHRMVRKSIRGPVWEFHRQEITRLWIDEDEELDIVMRRMKHQGFDASRAQYKLKFKQWGLQKRTKPKVHKGDTCSREDPKSELDQLLGHLNSSIVAARKATSGTFPRKGLELKFDLLHLQATIENTIEEAEQKLLELCHLENSLRGARRVAEDTIHLVQTRKLMFSSKVYEMMVGKILTLLTSYWKSRSTDSIEKVKSSTESELSTIDINRFNLI